MMVKCSLGTPAYMECGENVGLAPIHDCTELCPVIHLFETQMLDGSSGYDHPIVLLVSNLVECCVKREQVVKGCVC